MELNKSLLTVEKENLLTIIDELKKPLYQVYTISSGTLLNGEINLANEQMYKENIEFINLNIKEIIEKIDFFTSRLNYEGEESFNLGNCIQTTTKLIQPFLESNNILIHINYSHNMKIKGIETKLIQVFINILNSIIYILNQNKTLKEKHIFIEAKKIDGKKVIRIKDNGGVLENIEVLDLNNFNISKKISLSKKIIKEHFFGNIEVYDEGYSFNNKMFNGRVFYITFN